MLTAELDVMYFIFLSILLYNAAANENEKEELTLNDIASNLVSLLDVNATSNERLKELRDKLDKIDTYIIDKNKLAEMLINESIDTSLNETNFYKALTDEDSFRLLMDKEPKSLYLKLKAKINRDDILKMITDRNKTAEVAESARRMGDDMINRADGDKEVVNEVVDKILGEAASDNHKYDPKDLNNMYWDPQKELEDLNDYHKHDGRRIYRGERTSIKNYPFMVSVHVMGRFWCGGAIYTKDLVITSAACLQLMHNNRFFRENPRVLQVRVGSNHSRISGEVIDALEVFFHPSYNPRSLRNNIAVIRLRRSMFFSYHRVPKAIDISHFTTPPAPTSEVIVLGWGVTKMSQRMEFEPIYLQRKELPVYPNTFCKEIYGEKFITNTMFCAGTMTTGEGACDHDAGGPAILAGRLIGVISFGPSVCGYPNAPTVFTLVGAFADWIELINETMPDYYRAAARTTTTTPYTPSGIMLLAEHHMAHTLKVTPVDFPETTTEAEIPVIEVNDRFRAKDDEWGIQDNENK